MFCNNCGHQNPDDSKFCNNCGSPIPITQSFSEYNSAMVTPPQPYIPQTPPPQKTNKAPAIIILVVCVAILVAGIVLGVSLISGTDEEEAKPHTRITTTDGTTESINEDETEAPTQKPDSDNSPKIAHGTVNGNVYRNDFADITFTKPDGWKYYTDEELAKIFGLALDDYTEYEQTLIEKTTVYDMMIMSPEGANICIMFEDLSVSNAQIISVEAYCNNLSKLLQNQNKRDYEFGELFDCQLGNISYKAVDVNATEDGLTLYQRCYVRKIGKYMCVILVTVADADTIADVESMFSNYI